MTHIYDTHYEMTMTLERYSSMVRELGCANLGAFNRVSVCICVCVCVYVCVSVYKYYQGLCVSVCCRALQCVAVSCSIVVT